MSEEPGEQTDHEPRLCASVARARGEEARLWLQQQGLLDPHARVGGEGPLLFFPLSERAVPGATSPRESAEGCGARDDGSVDAGGLGPMAQSFATHFGATFAVREAKVRSRDRGAYQKVARVPEEERAALPQSFDHVGDIAVVKFDERNERWKDEVARAILASYKGIRAVAADEGVEGETRVRALRKIAGEGDLSTVYKEFGIAIEVDLSKTFFTPRLAGERRRLALLVAPYEHVLDAFAGVGPISLQIAKLQPTAEVESVDINGAAVEILRRNAQRNKLKNIRAHEGDFKAFAAAAKPRSFSRVVMNLPHRAKEFLPDALPLVALGGFVHLYGILPLEKIMPEQGQLGRIAEAAGARVTILRARPIKSYSPKDLFVVFDLRVDAPGK
ncbi:MAG TPA: methyltransferase [Candidatus Thermoplasmatota archaeon]|nr:methyltransferase [Candidatus Thermoplasmatota archaeon]